MSAPSGEDARLRELERAAFAESPAVVRWINALRRREQFPASLEGLLEIHRQLAAEVEGIEDILDRAGFMGHVFGSGTQTHEARKDGQTEPPACDWLACTARPSRYHEIGVYYLYSCEEHSDRVRLAAQNAQRRRGLDSFTWAGGPIPIRTAS